MTDDGPAEHRVRLVEYDPGWALEFARERDRILEAIDVPLVAIEHIGSTAVLGLMAKPVIDIMIGIADLDQADRCIEPLARLGYRYLPEYESEVPGRRLFRKGPYGASTHHVHIYRPDHPDWQHMLRLRTYFGGHPDVAREYVRLKQELVRRYPDDSVSYTEGKRAFLEAIRAAAAAEAARTSTPPPLAGLRRRARRVSDRARRALLRLVRMPRVGGWPRATVRQRPLEPCLLEARTTLERILVQAVLPFWRSRVVDLVNGGYHLNHGSSGRDLGPSARHVIAQTRTLWFFARLARSRWGEPSDLAAARHGFEFLTTRLWDRHSGGFAWEVLADGEPLHPHKHALAQAYALLAIADHWRTSQDEEALALARQTFEVWDRAAHDQACGGYVEMHRHDWSSADGLQGYWARDPGVKMLDTHLHIAEGLAALHLVAPEPRLAARLAELLGILTTADAGDACGVTEFRHDWSPQPKHRVEYGFDVKRIVVTARVCAAAGHDPVEHLELFASLFANAMLRGWDRRDGGLFEAGMPHRRANELVKPWWAQAELLVASLLMWRLTGQRDYAEVFLRTLDWVVRWQVDWDAGDWHATGRPSAAALRPQGMGVEGPVPRHPRDPRLRRPPAAPLYSAAT